MVRQQVEFSTNPCIVPYKRVDELMSASKASAAKSPARKRGPNRFPGTTKLNPGSTKRVVSKPFICWDGEGVTHDGHTKQDSVLLGNSEGEYITGKALSTLESLEFIIATADKYPNSIHVGYAFDYDANMILKDLTPHHFEVLAKDGAVRWGNFRIEHVPSKWLLITKRGMNGEKNKTVKINDVFGFFQTSFLKAINSYIPDSPLMSQLQVVVDGKAARKLFTYDELDAIIHYWSVEIALFKELVEKLREYLYSVDLFVQQWHGPGAIANYVYRTKGVEQHKDETIEGVRDAARYGYAGGRFELFRMGRHVGPIYGFDINSAYPAAIANLPSLTEGRWEHTDYPRTISEFGIYRIRMTNSAEVLRPGPAFHRDARSNITFPWTTENWYWSPEAHILSQIPGVEIIEAYEYSGATTKPFTFVTDMFNQRRDMKARKEGSEKAIKLALNSLYGKMAQRVGWEHTGTAPKWHQLSWAGYVTSSTRAKLYSVMSRIPQEKLIAVETDGIYTTATPAEVGITHSVELGGWEVVQYDEIMYAQSGVYFYKKDGLWTGKYRGLDAGSLTHESMAEYLSTLGSTEPWGPITGPTTRFIGYKSALMRQSAGEGEIFQHHRRWETKTKEINVGRVGKRIHNPAKCVACYLGKSAYEMPHDLVINTMSMFEPRSVKHDIPWEDTNNASANYRAYDNQSFAELTRV